MTPDIERLLVAWALTLGDVTAIVDQRIYTELPAGPKTWPLVRITLLDERSVLPKPRWLISSLIQVDCYGGPKVLARTGAGHLLDHIDQDLIGVHDLGVVTDGTAGALRYLPDQALDPAQPRYTFDLTVTHHPTPSASPIPGS